MMKSIEKKKKLTVRQPEDGHKYSTSEFTQNTTFHGVRFLGPNTSPIRKYVLRKMHYPESTQFVLQFENQ